MKLKIQHWFSIQTLLKTFNKPQIGTWSLIVDVSNSSTIITGYYDDFKVEYNKKTSKYKMTVGKFVSYSNPPLEDCLSKSTDTNFEYPDTVGYLFMKIKEYKIS